MLLLSLVSAPFVRAQGESNATIKATVKFLEGGAKSSTIVDPEQRTAVETVTDAKDRMIRKTTFLLDDHNFAMAAIHYDARGAIRYKESYQRDSANHVVESRLTNGDGASLGRRVFTYVGDKVTTVQDFDAQGNLLTPAKPPSQARPDPKRR